MDRQIVYPGAIPLETDLLNTNKNTMIALAKQALLISGTTTVIHGLSCTPTSPASMTVNIGPGQIYSSQNIDSTAYSSLSADTAHNIIKQGILLDSVPFTLTAPSTSGQSVNYLIQVAYQDVDSGSTVLPYYNAANPSVAWSGPANSGAAQNTVRAGSCVVAVKTGVAATTGLQSTPTPDVGYVGAWVITVANGQTSITTSNFTKASNAPFLPSQGLVAGMQSRAVTHAADTGTANNYIVSYSPPVTSLVDGHRLTFKALNTNTTTSTLSVNGLTNYPIYSQSQQALQGGEIIANGLVEVAWNSTLNAFIVCSSTGGKVQVPAATASNQAVNLGQLNAAGTGRLLNVQVFTSSGTYTPTSGTSSVVVEAIGGGGGSSAAPATTSTQVSIVCGGGAGAYGKGRYTSGFAGVTVTIGAGGNGGTSGSPTATSGGATSFGSLLTCPGGAAGLSAGPAVPPFFPQGGVASSAPTGANIVGAPGAPATPAYANATQSFLGSPGASSQLGGGGWAPTYGNAGVSGQAYGSGASGPCQGISGSLVNGAAGQSGIVVIYEYS
ncbi:phage tail protein [Serratia marcescens]|uniref:glycine-rich domain-containing protein n=1 Tax=Serratia marcescens TaxID=615 RepID=UPI0034E891FD